MKSYLDWVDEQIDQMQREIVKLTLAREIIVRANKVLKPENQISLGRKRTPRIEALDRAANVRQHILTCLAGEPPLVSKEITSFVLRNDPEITLKQVWNELYRLTQSGDILRNKETRLYSLPVRKEESDAA